MSAKPAAVIGENGERGEPMERVLRELGAIRAELASLKGELEHLSGLAERVRQLELAAARQAGRLAVVGSLASVLGGGAGAAILKALQ